MPLTAEQRRTAADNHKLIYKFLFQKKLDVDEWYDVAAIAYVNGILKFDPTRGLSLTTFLWWKMGFAVKSELIKQYEPKRSAAVMSMEQELEDSLTLHDKLSDGQSAEQAAINKLVVDTLLSCMDKQQRLVVRLRCAGFTAREIEKETDIPPIKIYQLFRDIRKLAGIECPAQERMNCNG